jgi:two-component system, chemotaxis family, response regulator WspR
VSQNRYILIIEDSLLMRNLLIGLLEGAGYGEIRAAPTLEEGLRMLGLRGEPATEHFSLVLMDKLLPDGDGIEGIKQIRQLPHLTEKPIIMVTGFDDRETLREAFDAGATDFINKSFDETELLARVRSALRLDAAIEAVKAREAELLRLTRELEKLSYTDGLTKVINRRGFDMALERAWAESVERRTPLAVVMLDVDHFKKYNDALGHQQGDECLKLVAQTLESQVHAMGEAHVLARYGGEEFAAILRVNANTAQIIAEKLRSSVAALALPHPNSGVGTTVSISVGVYTLIPDQTHQPSDALAHADAALYQAKNSGRNRVISRS